MKAERELLGVEKHGWWEGNEREEWGKGSACRHAQSELLLCALLLYINYIVLLYLHIIILYIYFTFYSSELRLFYDNHMA